MRTIDADALIDYLQMIPIDLGYREVEEIEGYVRSMPTTEPEQKTGKWILKEHLYECDKCGCRISRFPFKGNIWNYYFCPNCGAKMEEGEQE